MSEYTCPICGVSAAPADVEKDAVTNAWIVTCQNCKQSALQETAFSSADVERRRAEVA